MAMPGGDYQPASCNPHSTEPQSRFLWLKGSQHYIIVPDCRQIQQVTDRKESMIHYRSSIASSRGGVGIRLLFVAITLILIGVSIGYFLFDSQQRLKDNHRKAGRISEYGLQSALEEITMHPSWRQGFEKTPYDGGWYTVQLKESRVNDTLVLAVVAESHLDNASDRRECLLALSINGSDSTWVQRSLH
jgi:hypothetical protein